MKKVLITYNIFADLYRGILKDFDITMPPDGVQSFTYDEALSIIDEYDALHSMWNFPVDRRLLSAGKRLKIVSNFAVGYDNIDVAAATELGICIANTPDPVTEPTADVAMGLMIDVMRRITDFDKKQRTGKYVKGIMDNLGTSLWGKQLGIVGMGRIGSSLARRAKSSGMSVAYTNRNRLMPKAEIALGVTYMPLDELLRTSDVISLNAPLTSQTHHIINSETLAMMKPTAYLINTARGPLVDEKALTEALREQRISGAGLDVYEFNDTVTAELLTLPNTVLVPHIGTQTAECRAEMATFAAENIRNFFFGGRVAQVNKKIR